MSYGIRENESLKSMVLSYAIELMKIEGLSWLLSPTPIIVNNRIYTQELRNLMRINLRSLTTS